MGALVVGFLVALQLMDFFPNVEKGIFMGIGAAIVIGFGLYTQKLGSLLLFVLMLIMLPVATTEIGTDGWITSIMEGALENMHPGWILVYTSAIMLVLRFFAGPIVHKFSPLGLLSISSVLAIAGLVLLSGVDTSSVVMLFAAATLYGFGKTFFWPTMLGVVAEQTPKGGALTLNAMGGIGMLAVGTLGFPYIGVLQTQNQQEALVEHAEVATAIPGLIEDGKVTALEERSIYEVLDYQAIDDAKLATLVGKLPTAAQEEANTLVNEIRAKSNQGALKDMAIFPCIMLASYIGLILYFKSRGGYKAVNIG